MANSHIEIISLIEKKKELFLLYEQVTINLLKSDADTVADYITKREELATQIDGLTAKINEECLKQDSSGMLSKVAASKVDFANVPNDMMEVYEVASEFRSVAYRIKGMEIQIFDFLEDLKNEAAVKMKENQNMPKIKRYLNDLSDRPMGQDVKNTKI